jgi:hypothetical protein
MARRMCIVLERDTHDVVTPLDIGGALVLRDDKLTMIGASPSHDLVMRGCSESCDWTSARVRYDAAKDAWFVYGMSGKHPIWCSDEKVVGDRPLKDGDFIVYGGVRFRFALLDPDPLARVARFGPAVCIGCDDAPQLAVEPGRRDALLVVNGVVQRVTLLAREKPSSAVKPMPGTPAPIASFEIDKLVVDAVPSHAGVPLSLMPPAFCYGDDPLVKEHDAAAEAIVTWDGDVLYRPKFRNDHGTRYARGPIVAVERERVRDVVRGVMPDAWRAERELREQIAMLTPTSLPWLVERGFTRA